MHRFATLFTVAASLVASASAVAVPRATAPQGWLTSALEPYDTYHTRYMALSCNIQHNTEFFDQCCHPLLAGQSLSSRPEQCDPANDDESLPFCDEGDDGDDETTTTPTHASTSTHAPTSTEKPKPSSTPAPPPPKKTTSTAEKAVATPASDSGSSAVNTGGVATFFYQNGVAGACGTVHSDSDFIAAIDAARYGNLGKVSSTCGKKVQITNTQNKKTVTVTIADACPTCDNANSIDLSEGAFKQIATLDQGEVPITWKFI